MARNEQAALADNDVLASDAQVGQTRAFFGPQLLANGTYQRRAHEVAPPGRGPVQQLNALNAYVHLNQALFDWYQWTKLREAQGYSQAVRLQSEETKRLLAFEVAQAFFAVLAAEQKSQAAQQRARFAQRSLADAQARLAAQLVGANDVTLAELEMAAANTALAETTGAAEVSYIQLGYLVADSVAPPLTAPEDLLLQAAQEPPAHPEALAKRALQRRMDVRAQILQLQAADLGTAAPMRKYAPSLSAEAHGRATNETGFSGRTLDGFVGLNLTWSLYDGGLRYADQDFAQATRNRLQLGMNAVVRRVATDIRAAWHLLHSRQAALSSARAEAEAASRNADQTSALYRDGLTNALSVENASTKLFSAHVALAEVRYRLTLAYLDLQAAMGLDPLGREPAL